MASTLKPNGKFVKKGTTETNNSNKESSICALFVGAESKENKIAFRECNSSLQPKTKANILPKFFNFSSESEDEVESPPKGKSLLRERKMNSLKGSLSKKIYGDALNEHATKDHCVKVTPKSTQPKSEDGDLEWESLVETPHHFKTVALSGKKKLYAGSSDKENFQSTPKESRNRSKVKSLYLFTRFSQNPEFSEFTNDPDEATNNKEETVDFNECGEEEFVEVQDSSAQTSIQAAEDSHYESNNDSNNPKVFEFDLSFSANYKQRVTDKQQTGQEHLNANSERSLPSSNSTESHSDASLSLYHSQPSLSFDEDSTSKSRESIHSSQSFVDVQDASAQVELMLYSAQNDSLSSEGSSSVMVDKPFKRAGLVKPIEQSDLSNNSNGQTCEDGSSNGNHSTSSDNSSVFVSAEEIIPGRSNCSDSSQIVSRTSALTEKSCLFQGTTYEPPSGSCSDFDEVEASENNPSVLAENTDKSDSECSNKEEKHDRPAWRIQASFSDTIDSEEDLDSMKDKSEDKVLKSSLCKTEVCGETKMHGNLDTCQKDRSSIGEGQEVTSQISSNEGIGALADEKSSSISEISDLLKSTTISRRRRCSDSSDEDDAFEKFLTKMKTPHHTEMEEEAKLKRSMSDFIAADDEDLSGTSSSESISSEDEMFHVRTDNILDSKRRPGRKSLVNFEEESSDESEEDCKSKPVLELSSNDEDLLDDSIQDVAKLPKTVEKSKSVNSVINETPQTPQFQLGHIAHPENGAFQDNDFKTPFKTPRKPANPLKAWERPFETPAAGQGRKPSSEFRNQKNCPMTVSRLHHLSRRSNMGLDDNAVFLKSLSEAYPDYKRHPAASSYIKHFKDRKADLTEKLFAIYNKSIFKEQLPADLEIEWSALYRKTAGTFCYRSSTREAKITLSVKVCDRAERVRDTLAHELCHAAVRLINGVKESHGPVWRSWAQKVNRAFPFMPVIARCHDYVIATKYTYQCTKCNYRIGRHSKSLDTEKKVCGHCLGKFEVYLTRDLNSVSSEGERTPATPRTPRTPNKFALFVKESYAEVKKQDSNLKHADVMKILSRQFSEKTKVSE